MLGVELKRGRVLGYFLVHDWLREVRVVQFIVAVLAVADDVNNNTGLEFRSPFCSKFTDGNNFFRVVSVHMEYWRLNHFPDVGTIITCTRRLGIGCKANLVVHYNVNCAT